MLKLGRSALEKYQKLIANIPFEKLTDAQSDGMLAQLWETPAFRNYLIKRETALVLEMANRGKLPSDEEYQILYGRRLEVMELHDSARLAYFRAMKRRKDSTLAQGQ